MSEEKFWIEELRTQRKHKSFYYVLQKGRMRYLAAFFILIFAMLLSRLFYIQVLMQDQYSQKAVQQRMITIPLELNRGEIFDRNLIPFTDREVRKVIIAYPAYIHDKEAAAEAITKACDLKLEEVINKLGSTFDTQEFISKDNSNDQLLLIESGRIKGVIAVEKKIRYSEDGVARHVIGYVRKSDKTGQMGLEKSMNSFLKGGGADSIVAVVDSRKSIIPGLGFRKVDATEQGEGYNIKLTLDFHIQSIVEEVLKRNNINGAVVIMDVKTGEILSMASYPDYDQNDLTKHMSSSGTELINKSIWQFDFGSLFKTVVAAAALESNAIDLNEKYLCEGSIEVGNKMIKCSTHKTHENRLIDIHEAFALSCNTTFVKVGMAVGSDKILEMAKKLGFGEKQCHMLLEEKAGYLPTSQEDGIGNISIGQGKIQVTPIQVANMMAIIANSGIAHEARLVDELVNADGVTVKKMEKAIPRVVLSYSTVTQLKKMLAEVTKTGTGRQANMDAYGGSSGKTSSAETGIKSGEIVHGWFAGYLPNNSPKYAISVFVYNGQSGGKAAAPVFKEIATEIMEKYKR